MSTLSRSSTISELYHSAQESFEILEKEPFASKYKTDLDKFKRKFYHPLVTNHDLLFEESENYCVTVSADLLNLTTDPTKCRDCLKEIKKEFPQHMSPIRKKEFDAKVNKTIAQHILDNPSVHYSLSHDWKQLRDLLSNDYNNELDYVLQNLRKKEEEFRTRSYVIPLKRDQGVIVIEFETICVIDKKAETLLYKMQKRSPQKTYAWDVFTVIRDGIKRCNANLHEYQLSQTAYVKLLEVLELGGNKNICTKHCICTKRGYRKANLEHLLSKIKIFHDNVIKNNLQTYFQKNTKSIYCESCLDTIKEIFNAFLNKIAEYVPFIISCGFLLFFFWKGIHSSYDNAELSIFMFSGMFLGMLGGYEVGARLKKFKIMAKKCPCCRHEERFGRYY